MDDARPSPPKKRSRRPAAPTTPDPIEIAMEAAAKGAGADTPAQRLLVKQERLVGWQIAGERMGALLKGLLAVAAVALVVAVGAMMWSAHEDRGLVIEAFETPPDLAAKGLSGKVLATQLQDRLAQMQAETVAPDQARQVRSRWSGDIQVVIPQTGVSLGELNRFLRDWLGAQTHVSGEVYRVGEGRLALTVRAGSAAGAENEGPEEDIAGLVAAAAEAVYRTTQPIRYAAWLQQHGREAEALPILQAAAARGDPRERARAYMRLGLVETSLGQRLEYARAAKRLDPNNGSVLAALSNNENALGHVQAAVDLSRQVDRVLEKDDQLSPEGRRFLHFANVSNRELWTGAYMDGIADSVRQAEQTGAEEQVALNRLFDARSLVLAHDVQASRRLVGSLSPPGPEAPLNERQGFEGALSGVTALQAREVGDWTASLAALDALLQSDPVPGVNPRFALRIARAHALAQMGRFAEAESALAAIPSDHETGLVMRGQVAALKRDWPAAERWFAESERLAPRMPFAQTERGRMLLARGEAKAAATAFRIAHQRSPHYADPLELWGEALMAQGDYRGAAGKFTEAAKHAPRWGRLHLKWGQALVRQGRAAEAKAKFAAAATMDLTPAERAELAALRGRS